MFSNNQNQFNPPNVLLDLQARIDLDRAARSTWVGYLPQFMNGRPYKQRFINVVKRFRAKYAKDPSSIRIAQSDIDFIYECKKWSDYKKNKKLEESGITQEEVNESLINI